MGFDMTGSCLSLDFNVFILTVMVRNHYPSFFLSIAKNYVSVISTLYKLCRTIFFF